MELSTSPEEKNDDTITHQSVSQVSATANPRNRPDVLETPLQEYLFVAATTAAVAQDGFFQGAIISITALIGRDLDMTPAQITWISPASALTNGAFTLLFGRVADKCGRKKILIIGMAGFTCAVLIASFAQNPIYMDVFSGIAGLFCASVVPPAIGTLSTVYETASIRRNRVFACFGAGRPLGYVGGMIISGIAADVSTWRASFRALACIYAVFTVLGSWAVPADHVERMPLTMQTLNEFDLLGTVLIITGLAGLSSALSLAGDAPHGWQTPYIIILLCAGCPILLGFLWWEYITRYPLMPLSIWRDKTFSSMMIVHFLGTMGFESILFWLSLVLQNIRHDSPIIIAAELLPMIISGVAVNVVCALILHKVSNRVLTGVGVVGYTTAFLILSFLPEDAPYWKFIFPSLVMLVIGSDIHYNVANMYVMAAFPPKQQSLAGGIFNTVSCLSVNLGLGISTAIHLSVKDQANPITPYVVTFWFAAVASSVSIFFVPFVRIGTQSGKEEGSTGSTQSSAGSHTE